MELPDDGTLRAAANQLQSRWRSVRANSQVVVAITEVLNAQTEGVWWIVSIHDGDTPLLSLKVEVKKVDSVEDVAWVVFQGIEAYILNLRKIRRAVSALQNA